MILIDPKVSELVVGFELITGFITSLETTWLPGFERSYERRSEEYRRALQKHKERGFFLRTLLKEPKAPNRPPTGLKTEMSARLLDEWQDSFRAAISSPSGDILNLLTEHLDDRFYAITELQLLPNMTAPAIVIGPAGIYLFSDSRTGLAVASSLSTQARVWQQTADEIADMLPDLESDGEPNPLDVRGGICLSAQEQPDSVDEVTNPEVLTGDDDFWRGTFEEGSAQALLDQEMIFTVADKLLERHQDLAQIESFSALAVAEKLSKREKDNLLRLAATL